MNLSFAFALPTALLLLLGTFALVVLTALTLRWQARIHARLAGGSEAPLLHGATSHRRRAAKAGLALLALVLLVIGAAGPKLGQPEAPRSQRTDIMIVLDVSLSMLAPDVQPSRFEAARRNVEALLNSMKGDCVGLTIFGGRAALRMPCTVDYAAVRSVLRATSIDSAPLAGSSIEEGLRTGLGALRQSASPRKSILLISDGEDTASSDVQAVLSELQATGIVVHVLGTGSAQGSSIPQPAEDGRVTLKQDSSGRTVISRLGERILQQIASETGGSYGVASASDEELRRLYDAQRPSVSAAAAVTPALPFGTLTLWLALIALVLLMSETMVSWRNMGGRQPSFAWASMVVFLLATLVLGCDSRTVNVYSLNRAGLDAYGRGVFDSALDAFQQAQAMRPETPELYFNAGAALYENAHYEDALSQWRRAVGTMDETLRRSSDFNQGNALYRLERYEDAAEAYKRVLRVSPDDLDAKINLELTLRRLRGEEVPEEQLVIPPGTLRSIPLGDLDPGPQGNQPQPPLRPSDGQQGPDPRDSALPQLGGQAIPQPGTDPRTGQPQEQTPPMDPIEALRRAIEEAGEDVTEEEALNILAALRLREPSLQERYNAPSNAPGGLARLARPERDW